MLKAMIIPCMCRIKVLVGGCTDLSFTRLLTLRRGSRAEAQMGASGTVLQDPRSSGPLAALLGCTNGCWEDHCVVS
jgi:hypothetical protein